MKIAYNLSRHKISHVFKIWLEWTIYFGVYYVLIGEKTIFDLGILKSGERSLPFGQLGFLHSYFNECQKNEIS